MGVNAPKPPYDELRRPHGAPPCMAYHSRTMRYPLGVPVALRRGTLGVPVALREGSPGRYLFSCTSKHPASANTLLRVEVTSKMDEYEYYKTGEVPQGGPVPLRQVPLRPTTHVP